MAKKFVDIGTQSTLDKILEITDRGTACTPTIKQEFDSQHFTIKIVLTKGRTMLCDREKYFLLDGNAEEIDNGYLALETGTFIFQLSKYFANEPYTII